MPHLSFAFHQKLKKCKYLFKTASYINIITDVFLRLIKMIIAPLVFATIVTGLMSIGGSCSVSQIT
ncbi:cation:dicarboxylate symporter family transporter [Xenorhabdus khoisanae]|uniref:cation:dicarboxylate symporter family transporter n=1 Tax=Xenorhabdus khoisanae TaxID=880157 RepID=UPI003D6F86DC